MDVQLTSGPVGLRTYTGHYSQILTGFSLLTRQGLIRLSRRGGGTGVQAEVDGRKLYYDILDGPEIDSQLLDRCDYYFKRSFVPGLISGYPLAQRIMPLGLNYEVYPDGPHWPDALRALHGQAGYQDRLRGFFRALRLTGSFLPTLSAMTQARSPATPSVIFLTQVWSAKGHDHPAGPDVEAMNQTRATCIRLLKKQFGTRALVGFWRTPLAERIYPDLIADVRTDKEAYFLHLQNATIGVSTTGLFGSNPWKLGEYVAFGKAIVSEPLYYQAPDFNAGVHYLEFRSPDECVERVQRLFDQPDLCEQIAARNCDYYRQLLQPDRLVLRTLKIATGDSGPARV